MSTTSPSTSGIEPARRFRLKLPRYRLADLLERDANNLDLVRLAAACLVIFGHAFVLVPEAAHPFGTWDPTARYLGYPGVYSASVAVKLFFFISGLLVTHSLLERQSLKAFLLARFFRIWPAYLVMLLVTAFVIGPLHTNLEPGEYFGQPGSYRYFWQNALLLGNASLPGVFVDNPYPNQINGAIWSLTYEVAAYAGLFGLFVLRLTRRRFICSVLAILMIVDPLLPHSLFFPAMTANPQIRYLPASFALGAWLALCKDRITLGPLQVGAAIAGFLLLHATPLGPLAFFVCLFLTILYMSGLPLVRCLKISSDPSYGTFLWGFVIQQVVAAHFADRGLVFNLVMSLGLAMLAGFLSWHLIERRAIALGRRLISDRRTPGVPAK